mgnify:CR=1 FL=1
MTCLVSIVICKIDNTFFFLERIFPTCLAFLYIKVFWYSFDSLLASYLNINKHTPDDNENFFYIKNFYIWDFRFCFFLCLQKQKQNDSLFFNKAGFFFINRECFLFLQMSIFFRCSHFKFSYFFPRSICNTRNHNFYIKLLFFAKEKSGLFFSFRNPKQKQQKPTKFRFKVFLFYIFHGFGFFFCFKNRTTKKKPFD